ncbi:hypothetical protein ZOSMA_41G00790 [Zostera marina]|uniref:Uncharacterized protein n=1 Tax=Zostera marina TaxID=29655 RepID=A0A0K9P4Y0_ZOSMR|nr:hypothetical protein ZOSMA_41G00790 [Zostera marina]
MPMSKEAARASLSQEPALRLVAGFGHRPSNYDKKLETIHEESEDQHGNRGNQSSATQSGRN